MPTKKGRIPKPPGEKFTARSIRASPEDWATIEAKAAAAGLPVAAYMRLRALA